MTGRLEVAVTGDEGVEIAPADADDAAEVMSDQLTVPDATAHRALANVQDLGDVSCRAEAFFERVVLQGSGTATSPRDESRQFDRANPRRPAEPVCDNVLAPDPAVHRPIRNGKAIANFGERIEFAICRHRLSLAAR